MARMEIKEIYTYQGKIHSHVPRERLETHDKINYQMVVTLTSLNNNWWRDGQGEFPGANKCFWQMPKQSIMGEEVNWKLTIVKAIARKVKCW